MDTNREINNAHSDSKNEGMYIIGVGASAGGLEALQNFLSHLPHFENSFSIIIAQHLSPTYKSMLVQLLSRATKLNVQEITNDMKIQEGVIYITPPDSEVLIKDNHLHLTRPFSSAGPKPSIDQFFTSLAQQHKEKAIGIILSGTGSDGAEGIRNIKDHGGLTLCQVPSSAKYDGMPMAAIQTGYVDFVLNTDIMGDYVQKYMNFGFEYFKDQEASDTDGTSVDRLLKLLSQRTGTNFSDYKQSTICRRLEKRITSVKLESVEDYLEYIDRNPDELDELFNTILIGVTSFFRDDAAFEHLETYLRHVIERKKTGDSIRVWVPGCATGEEPYSIAILLTRILKERMQDFNIQIFATDIDEKAITFARRGIFSKTNLENVRADILNEFFAKQGEQYELSKAIRQLVLFSKHDVTVHPPFLKLDLISCRNLLIYFGQNLQKHIIPIFHYALNPNGYLFLGKSESIGQFSNMFTTLDGKFKIFQRKQGNNLHTVKFTSYNRLPERRVDATVAQKPKSHPTLNDVIMKTLYNFFDSPYIVVDDSMEVKEIFGDISIFLKLREGTMNANIISLAVKPVQIELRTLLSRSIRDKIELKGEYRRYDFLEDNTLLRIVIKPLLFSESFSELYIVIFETITLDDSLCGKNESLGDAVSDGKVKELEKELELTKEHLQTYIEELETANEELQSLNEEMQSSNEELQSSNEELETSNEELQSSNEEIQIAYSELRHANKELQKKENDLKRSEKKSKALLNNTHQALILIDKNYKILSFNISAKTISSRILGREIVENENMLDYVAFVQMKEFYNGLREALNGKTSKGEIELLDLNKKKNWYSYAFSPVIDEYDRAEFVSFGLIDVTDTKLMSQNVNEMQLFIDSVFEIADIGLCIVTKDRTVFKVNKGFTEITGYNAEDITRSDFLNLFDAADHEKLKEHHLDLFEQNKEYTEERELIRKDGTQVIIKSSSKLLKQSESECYRVVTMQDITSINRYQKILEYTQEAVAIGGWEYDFRNEHLTWTEEVYRIHDVSTEFNIQLENALNFYESESRKILQEAIDDAINKGKPYDLELILVSAARRKKWIRTICKPMMINQKIVKLMGTIQDITDLKNSEFQIKKLSFVASKIQSGVLIADARRKIEWINKSFENMIGYDIGSLSGKLVEDVLCANQGEATIKESIRTKTQNAEVFSDDVLNYRANGVPFWQRIEITPIKDSKNNVTNFIIIATDITNRKQEELELILAKEKAEELNRLKANFLGNMSHELRTPMVGIIGFAEAIYSMKNTDEKVRNIGWKILESSNRLMRTLKSLVDLSLVETNRLVIENEEIDLTKLLYTIIRSFHKIADKKNIELKLSIPERDVTTYLDSRIVKQIITNLLDNAIKFTKKGEIVVTLEEPGKTKSNMIALTIADTGIGISPEAQEFIFEEFRQISEGRNRNFEGVGIGLSIAKKFVEILEGEISFQEREKGGTIFNILLPYKQTEPDVFVPVEDNNTSQPDVSLLKNKKILLLEDETFQVEVLDLFLSDICDLTIATDFESALKKIDGTTYDIFLLDINLGKGKTGFEFAQLIREYKKYKDTPIVAFTAYAREADKQDILAQEFTHFLAKPFTRIELFNLLINL